MFLVVVDRMASKAQTWGDGVGVPAPQEDHGIMDGIADLLLVRVAGATKAIRGLPQLIRKGRAAMRIVATGAGKTLCLRMDRIGFFPSLSVRREGVVCFLWLWNGGSIVASVAEVGA